MKFLVFGPSNRALMIRQRRRKLQLFLLFVDIRISFVSQVRGLNYFNKLSIGNFIFSQNFCENHILFLATTISTQLRRKISQCDCASCLYHRWWRYAPQNAFRQSLFRTCQSMVMKVSCKTKHSCDVSLSKLEKSTQFNSSLGQVVANDVTVPFHSLSLAT